MNEDQLKGKWKQMRGKVKQQWGRLTDDDLDKIAGSRDILVGRIQEQYGYSREIAQKEVDQYLS